MLEKDPTTYSYITYAWVLGLACWGGTVNFITKIKTGTTRPFNITEFLGEIVTSAFSGVVTFYLCELSLTPPLMTAVFVAISGHMGTRLIFKLEQYLEKRFKKLTGSSDAE
jgi:hypothetical protein